jgi:hypothetical protein
MREEFQRVDAMNLGVDVIEKIVAGRLQYLVAHK